METRISKWCLSTCIAYCVLAGHKLTSLLAVPSFSWIHNKLVNENSFSSAACWENTGLFVSSADSGWGNCKAVTYSQQKMTPLQPSSRQVVHLVEATATQCVNKRQHHFQFILRCKAVDCDGWRLWFTTSVRQRDAPWRSYSSRPRGQQPLQLSLPFHS